MEPDHGIGVGRIQFHRRREIIDGRADLPRIQLRTRTVGIEGGISILQGDRAVVVRDRAVELALREIALGATGECGGVFGSGFDRLVEGLDGAAIVAGDVQHVSAACVGERILGVELDGLVVVLQRPIVFPLGVIGVAAVSVEERLLGSELDGLVVTLDRTVVVTLGVIGEAR